MKGYMKKVVCAAMVMAMTTSLMAGCSASGSSSTSTASGSSSSGSTSVTTVKVGTGNSAAPFCYLDDNGELIGYDVDVLHELDARLEQYEFDIQSMDFSTLVVSIDSGNIDMLAHELVKSDARKEKYIFPDQYYCLSPMVLAVRDDSGITSMEDMAGKSLDQNPSAYEYQMLTAYNDAHPGKEVVINAVSDQTTADGYKKVSNGQVDASLTYSATFNSVMKDLSISNLVITKVVMCEDTYLMFPKTQTELCAAVNDALVEMMKDGTLSKLSEKWYGEDVFTLYSDMVQITVD